MIMAKILRNICCLISVLLIIWFVMSWMDIVADNCFPNPVHHPWNMFMMLGGK
jgi:hypothetical protein